MKKSLKMKYLYPMALLVLPLLTFAQSTGVAGILGKIQAIIQQIVPILIGLAVLYFLWGVLQYVTAKDSEKQKEARSIMIYGIIILFVMVSIWGLVGVLQETLGVGTATPKNIDLIPRR